MGMSRDELEAQSREALVVRAQSLGIPEASKLTRSELVDELLSATVTDDQERKAARGLLGRARDLVARVVEKGLHLPDAASRLRTLSGASGSEQDLEPLPTVALAHVYASQGHRKQALAILDDILRREPNNEPARDLHRDILAQYASGRTTESAAPASVDDSPLDSPPPHAPRIPTEDALHAELSADRVRLAWRLRPTAFARGRAKHPAGRLVLRLVHVIPTPAGPESLTDDREIDALSGSMDVKLPSDSASTCFALGWRDGSDFTVFATHR